ncbi:hypothetical protein V8E54_002035 [Elaphomyces granulatus]
MPASLLNSMISVPVAIVKIQATILSVSGGRNNFWQSRLMTGQASLLIRMAIPWNLDVFVSGQALIMDMNIVNTIRDQWHYRTRIDARDRGAICLPSTRKHLARNI